MSPPNNCHPEKAGLITSWCFWITQPPSRLESWKTRLTSVLLNYITATCLPSGLVYIKRVVSSLTNGWHCPSWEPTVERISSCKALSGLFCRSCLRYHAPVSIMTTLGIYTRCGFLSHLQWGLLLALTTGDTSLSLALFSIWPQNVTASLKSAAHRSSSEEQIMRLNQPSIQWPISSDNVHSSSSCSSKHCSSLSLSVYQSVPPHMGLFLARGNSAVVCFCAGVGLRWRASEKYGIW